MKEFSIFGINIPTCTYVHIDILSIDARFVRARDSKAGASPALSVMILVVRRSGIRVLLCHEYKYA